MNWLSDNYRWLFDGVGGAAAVALLLYLIQRLFRSRTQPSSQESQATLTVQASKVTNSPIASGSGINQNVNSPTVNLNLGAPLSEGIHKRRVDALLAINSKLEEALFYLQRAASSFKYQGEASDREILQRTGRALAAASEEYSQNKLLISPPFAHKLDEFFNKMVSAGMTLNLAVDRMIPDGEPRAKLWEQAQGIAYKEIPLILEAIQTEARAIIHG